MKTKTELQWVLPLFLHFMKPRLKTQFSLTVQRSDHNKKEKNITSILSDIVERN